MYGYRARIGYTVGAVAAEVFPIDFYKIVPDGVTLMMITPPPGGPLDEVEKCRAACTDAARTFAECGADLVLLGGLPIKLSHASGNLDDFLKQIEDKVGVQVSSSTTAQQKAYKALGSRKIGIVHPFKPEHSANHARDMKEFFGFEPVGVYAGGWNGNTLGKIPIDCALEWGRTLKKDHPDIDTISFTCPHWRVIDAIEPLERELQVNVMTTLQAIAWEAMRRTGVNDRIEGYGRLLREF